MFFFKRSEIVLDCFTSHAGAYTHFPVSRGVTHIPEWFKNIPPSYNTKSSNGISFEISTMKGCVGFIELYKNSITIPLWSDLIVETSENGYAWVGPGITNINDHPSLEYGDNFKDYIHNKIASPWIMREKSGVNFVFMPPVWEHIGVQNVEFLSGVINFKYQHSTNINMLIHKNSRVKFDAGTPMCHLIPLTEKKVVIKTHLVSEEEAKTIALSTAYRFKFMGNYRETKKIIDSKSKCPFGFGK